MSKSPQSASAAISCWVIEFCTLWQARELAPLVTVEFSSRMKRSLGLTYPKQRLIRLRHDLKVQSQEILKEVVCHELAHVVAYWRFGHRIKPHGPQWRQLMLAASYQPRVTLDAPLVTSARYPVRRFRHACPVCQTSKVAYRKMRRWRCGDCLANGRSGSLRVEEVL